jgi:acetyltransferase-like isoleucine patch superfamily enzyme
MITDVDHSLDNFSETVMAQPLISKKTDIGDFCFIGAGVRILAGTLLGWR